MVMKSPHRARISSRRRALFPPDENSTEESDLACISPLNIDDGICLKSDRVFSLNECVGDYDIIGLVEKNSSVNTPKSVSTSSDLSVITPSQVTDDSPTQKLKTPHDTSTSATILPKLTRKTVPDTTLAKSDSHNQDNINRSKVRTALFPDMSLSSKVFYPQAPTEFASSSFTFTKASLKKKSVRKNTLYLCNRRGRLKSGEINAGVSHKIRKVKKIKKLKKEYLLQAAINIIEKSPLNTILPENMDLKEDFVRDSPSSEDQEAEIDTSKKFFKSSHHRGVVTVGPNIKLEVNNGKISLMSGKIKRDSLKRSKREEEVEGTCLKKMRLDTDFDNETSENLISSQAVCGIIDSLEDKENREEKQDVLMSPTSQMCNMTSGLALNSPKKAKNLNTVLETMCSSSEQKKLFPVFYPGKTVPQKKDLLSNKSNGSVKKFKGLSKDQMLLDAGQKRFGVTQCSECKIIYHMGDPGDEIMHLNYHNAGHIFRFNGWKNERVVSSYLVGGKIIQIVPSDSKIWWKKVRDVMEVINRDLGFYDIDFKMLNSQVFLFIHNKLIVGALVAETKTVAYKLLTAHQDQVDLCSEESYPIKCGVSRIWVSQNHRKKGIATALMDSLKRNFMFGCILRNEDIAFSSPTEMGKLFGQNYFKTPNFLVYFV